MFENHKREAERLLASEAFTVEENTLLLQEANIQATLHVAEQQHVANMIALYNSDIISDSSREILADKIKNSLVTWEES